VVVPPLVLEVPVVVVCANIDVAIAVNAKVTSILFMFLLLKWPQEKGLIVFRLDSDSVKWY
jgi:hypothetical protein